MKLLIITQKVDENDPILGFFCDWLEEFARNAEKLTVICLDKGQYNLPNNVKILSLGKENGKSRLKYLINFYKFIWQERKNYDSVFVHMNQIYVVLGGWLWKILSKKISLWYVHRQKSLLLYVAEFFADYIFTTTKEAFTIPSKKLHIVGHGINVKKFESKPQIHEGFKIISVGRITRIKNLEILIRVAEILKGNNFSYKIIGPTVTSDDLIYLNELKKNQKIEFLNAVPNKEILKYYKENDINVNLTPTGGMDKVVLEGVLAGVIPLTSNRAFAELFNDENLFFEFQNADDLAKKILGIYNMKNKNEIIQSLQEKVMSQYGLESLVNRITNIIKNEQHSNP